MRHRRAAVRAQRRWVAGIALLLGVLAVVWPVWARAELRLVTPGSSPTALADAVREAQDGDVIGLMSGTYTEALVVENRRLTFRGIGAQPTVISGEGKAKALDALWQFKGGQVVLQNLTFRGARSPMGTGTAVQQQGGRLVVQGSTFEDNEQCLVALNDERAVLEIRDSVFARAPKVEGGLFHLLNVGRIAKLEMTGSRLQQGFEGHLVKTRARENLIAYNSLNDGVYGAASYEVEIASGGIATLVGNVFGQGIQAANPTMLAYGTDGLRWDRNELWLAHNTFINYGWSPAVFVRSFDDPAGARAKVVAVNNLLVGPGVFWPAVRGELAGNRYATRGMLNDLWTYAMELPIDSVWRDSGVDPRNIHGRDLSPQAEFEFPQGTRRLAGPRSRYTPGAFQR